MLQTAPTSPHEEEQSHYTREGTTCHNVSNFSELSASPRDWQPFLEASNSRSFALVRMTSEGNGNAIKFDEIFTNQVMILCRHMIHIFMIYQVFLCELCESQLFWVKSAETDPSLCSG